MLKRLSIIAMLGLCMIATTGCFEIEEKVAISPDGQASSKVTMRLVLPQDEKKKEIPPQMNIKAEEIGKGVEGFESANVSSREIFGQYVVDVLMKANSWKALAKVYNTLPKEKSENAQNSPQQGIDNLFTEKGFYTFKQKGKNIVITRTFLPTKKKEVKKDKKQDKSFEEMMNMMMSGMVLRMELKVPTKIISSNAEESDGQMLRWILPLDYLSKNKVVLNAEIESSPELLKSLF